MKFNPDDLIDINQRLGIPRTYRFNPELRWLTILVAFIATGCSLWFILFRINMDFPVILRILPFLVIFFAFQSMYNQMTMLNAIVFEQDRIMFLTIAKRPVEIPWASFRKMEFSTKGFRSVKITYETPSGPAEYSMTITFRNILEIVNSIAELCPQLEYDPFIKNVIVGERAKIIERGEHADS